MTNMIKFIDNKYWKICYMTTVTVCRDPVITSGNHCRAIHEEPSTKNEYYVGLTKLWLMSLFCSYVCLSSRSALDIQYPDLH